MKVREKESKQDIDIEQLLIWVYQDQAAEQVAGKGLYSHSGGGDAFGAVERYGRLGCFIDCAGSAAVGTGELHPDAEAVYETVGFDPLIVRHARSGTRPDWMEGAVPHFKPVDGWKEDKADQRVPRRYDYNINAGIGNRPWLCRVRLVNHPDMIAYARRQYLEWWEALAVLSGRMELREYNALPPSAAAKPWMR